MSQRNRFALWADTLTVPGWACDGTFRTTHRFEQEHQAPGLVDFLVRHHGARCDCDALRAVHAIPRPEERTH